MINVTAWLFKKGVYMFNYYFTFGSDKRFPFQMGYVIVKANDQVSACKVFKAYFPNRPGSDCLNCSFVYNEEEFMKYWETVWNKTTCHGIIEFKSAAI